MKPGTGQQLDKRNLTPDWASYLRGLKVQATPRVAGERTDLTSGKTFSNLQALADEQGVTTKTLHRDSIYAEAVDGACVGRGGGERA